MDGGKDRRRVVAVFGHIDASRISFSPCLWEERHGTDESRAPSHLLPRFEDGVLPHYDAISSGKFLKRLDRRQRGYIVHRAHQDTPRTACASNVSDRVERLLVLRLRVVAVERWFVLRGRTLAIPS